MKWLLILLLLPLVLGGGALLLNRVPLWAEPGPLARLKVYLGSNAAVTRDDHVLPELRTPQHAADVAAVRACLLSQMRRLGWRSIGQSGDGLELSAVVATPLLGFRDDVVIRLQPVSGGTLLHARSRSRVGKADFGANLHHLQQLFAGCRWRG